MRYVDARVQLAAGALERADGAHVLRAVLLHPARAGGPPGGGVKRRRVPGSAGCRARRGPLAALARRGGRAASAERCSWSAGRGPWARRSICSSSRPRRPRGTRWPRQPWRELRRVEGALSRFDEASDLSELNRAAGRGPQAIGQDLGTVLDAAERFRRADRRRIRSRGRAAHARVGLPRAAHLAADLRRARGGARGGAGGPRGASGRSATLAAPPPSSIWVASAWAMASIGWRRVLRGAGIRRAFLDVSGDCLAIGAPPGERAGWWRSPIPARPGGGERQRPAPGCGARHLGQHRVGGPLGARGPGPRHGSGDRLSGGSAGPGHGAGANRHRGRRAVHCHAGLAGALRRRPALLDHQPV